MNENTNNKKDWIQLKELGNTAFSSGEYDRAIQYYTQAIVLLEANEEKGNAHSILFTNRSIAHFNSNNFRCAVEGTSALMFFWFPII